tara:strand:+ start:50 stop:325 length:276 start_codon:yes stop_codon:yes gene_type:complete
MNKKNFFLKIFGRVQGVGYRVWTKRLADSLNFVGWVKNCDDGTVEIEIYCDEKKKNLFKNKCYKGPLLSKVERIEETSKSEKKFNNFEILF